MKDVFFQFAGLFESHYFSTLWKDSINSLNFNKSYSKNILSMKKSSSKMKQQDLCD